MNEVSVVIVGAGPAGLVLALSLAKYKIHSKILEKELEIGEDPRGVYLAGDAVRVLYQLGIGDQMAFIGHQADSVNFHRSSFKNTPFFQLPTSSDWLEQAVPGGIYQIQPRLEATLRAAVSRSPYCDLEVGCNVISREERSDGIIVSYEKETSVEKIEASWLIGADGKTGVVRKQFLEPAAGVRQEVGLFPYTGTWVAANLKITPPTPETHPELCFWKLGMTPDDVYDLFWPANWHFCSPPGKATACGRFGPTESRYWRHEFAEPDWDDTKDALQLLWEHLIPMITRNSDKAGRPFIDGNVTYPQDCIEVVRCRPFTFCQKVVNKWFHNRTILIGDAAHVFPPFGGQGIASGIRDGDALAWRLALLLRMTNQSKSLQDEVLRGWSAERREGVDDSTRLTMSNGKLCNDPETWGFFLFRRVASLLSVIPGFPTVHSVIQERERAGYRAARNGFFLPSYGGGGKIAQIYVASSQGQVLLSDEVLQHGEAVMTVLILDDTQGAEKVRHLLRKNNMPTAILSEQSLIVFSSRSQDDKQKDEWYQPCPRGELKGFQLQEGYDEQSYLKRFPPGTKYAILRPDLIIFAACKTIMQLDLCLEELKRRLGA